MVKTEEELQLGFLKIVQPSSFSRFISVVCNSNYVCSTDFFCHEALSCVV